MNKIAGSDSIFLCLTKKLDFFTPLAILGFKFLFTSLIGTNHLAVLVL
jgi:hypothetical protein